jgi:hypothetical protein
VISLHLRIIAIAGSVALLLFIIELVRRRRLKEEYSVLWVVTAIVLIVLASWGGLLHTITHAIGAVAESSTLYFFGLLFVVFLLLNFSVKVSVLERRLTAVVQEIALLSPHRPSSDDAQECSEEPSEPERQDDAMRT